MTADEPGEEIRNSVMNVEAGNETGSLRLDKEKSFLQKTAAFVTPDIDRRACLLASTTINDPESQIAKTLGRR
jgi:hypothetical protein